MAASSPQFPVSRRTLLAEAGAVSSSAALAACGGDGRGGGTSAAAAVSRADTDRAMSTATELAFWAWVPDIAQEVALFEQNHPAVTVKVVNAGQGGPEYTKLRTALQADTRCSRPRADRENRSTRCAPPSGCSSRPSRHEAAPTCARCALPWPTEHDQASSPTRTPPRRGPG